jgi:hypothetical protein
MLELVLLAALTAQPESWIWESAEASERESKVFRFSPRLNFWKANFDRPPRACRADILFQFPQAFCNPESSDELGFGSGVEFSFRTWGPFYVTAGIDFLYTAPSTSSIKNQLVFALPFGLTITWYEWAFRPIAHFDITPVLYVTDDSRDFTVGGSGGVAYRILDFGSISLTGGYLWAETMTAVQVQIGVHPIL